MERPDARFYDFGQFRVDVLKRRLMRGAEVLPLTSKAFSTLLFLVERRGQTVSKEELMNAVWAETAVEENNLTQQISALRKALGERARRPEFIITISGRGYSFIAPVSERSGPETESGNSETRRAGGPGVLSAAPLNQRGLREGWRIYPAFRTYAAPALVLLCALLLLPVLFAPGLLNARQPAICVLPFRALNNNEKSSIYSAGIPSYVTAKIGNLPNMIVRPPSSAAAADTSGEYFGQEQSVWEAARENNVDAVLTGSTLCEGESVQVIVHLWDVKTKRQIWAKVFTTDAENALNVQEKISEEIISVLRTELID